MPHLRLELLSQSRLEALLGELHVGGGGGAETGLESVFLRRELLVLFSNDGHAELRGPRLGLEQGPGTAIEAPRKASTRRKRRTKGLGWVGLGWGGYGWQRKGGPSPAKLFVVADALLLELAAEHLLELVRRVGDGSLGMDLEHLRLAQQLIDLARLRRQQRQARLLRSA